MKPLKIQINAYTIEENKRGLGFHLSTYDVPRSGSATFDKDTGVLTIAFEYIDTEPARRGVNLSEGVNASVGYHSGKILTLEIDVARQNIGEVRVTVSKAIDNAARALAKQIKHLSRPNQRENYALVRSVLEGNLQILATEAAAP